MSSANTVKKDENQAPPNAVMTEFYKTQLTKEQVAKLSFKEKLDYIIKEKR